MPITAVIGGRIFCVHGGLSPKLSNLQLINQIKRPTDIIKSTLMCDMLWSDPNYRLDGWTDNL